MYFLCLTVFLWLEKRPSADERSTASMGPEPLQDGDYTLIRLSEEETVVEFSTGSKANPVNWTFNKKLFNAAAGLLIVLNCGISSSLPSNAIPTIMQDFGQSGNGQKILPTAIFLIGYLIGPIVFSPGSEIIGRRPVLVWSFTIFFLGTIACAFAPNWPALLVFRLICGTMAAAPQTVVAGVYADLFEDMRTRGRAMALYMAASSFGPIVGPIISGCSVQYGWRWTFRIDIILSAVGWLSILFYSETFAPALLKNQAKKLRKVTGNNHYVAPQERTECDHAFSMRETITRPLTMLLFEPIVLFISLDISLAWSMVYFYFQAYPIIFEGTYGFDVAETSLTYIPIGIGAASSCIFSIFYDNFFEKAQNNQKPWASGPETQRLPLSCASAPCLTISLFWLAWSARPTIHWIVPVLSGVIFGLSYQATFISLLTYLTDAYRIYSASALAASVIMRSVAGALFPLAADPLYGKLGVAWGTSILGFVSLACIPIPFALYYYGPAIRKRSPFCQKLLEADRVKSSSGRTTPEE
ncbi:major facilitator superfamily domain-containing protein, partial [Penicillium chermesinum]